MLPFEFDVQMKRLELAFGKNFFNEERKKIIWRAVSDLPHSIFTVMVDKFVRTSRSAPLPQDIIDLANQERKRHFNNEVAGAARSVNSWATGSLRRALDANPDWKGCKTLMEAVEVQVLKNQIKRVEQP